MTTFIDNRINGEGRIDHRRNAFALFAHGIAVKQTRAHARSSSAAFEIERQHVRGFDRFRRRQARTNRFATAGEPREVMKPDGAGDNYLRELSQSTIYF